MAYNLQRIGKSLVKYFKPIRVAAPHIPGQKPNDRDESQKGFRLLKFKKPGPDAVAESKAKVSSGTVPEETALEVQQPALPEKAHTQWLDMVAHLLGACKRVSQKMTRKMGMANYKKAVLGRGTHKLKTLGSIVDTKGMVDELVDPEQEKKLA